jgi:hypothetical protein
MSDALELTFETPIPLVGQIMALEAVDHLYSLLALAESDWRGDIEKIEDWEQKFVTLPGKLLAPENTLQVTGMYPGSATEVLKGLAGPVAKLVEFLLLYRQKRRQANLQEQSEKLKIVLEQLLPLMDKMKKRGIAQKNIQATVIKAFQFVDEVLDGMMSHDKLTIKNVSSTSAERCSKCGQAVRR